MDTTTANYRIPQSPSAHFERPGSLDMSSFEQEFTPEEQKRARLLNEAMARAASVSDTFTSNQIDERRMESHETHQATQRLDAALIAAPRIDKQQINSQEKVKLLADIDAAGVWLIYMRTDALDNKMTEQQM